MLAKTSRRANRTRDMGNLLTALLQSEAGPEALVSLKNERPWASITFSGTRYRFEIRLPVAYPAGSIQQRLAKLMDHEFDLPGHFVADFLMHEKRPRDAFVIIEILTIADPVSEKS